MIKQGDLVTSCYVVYEAAIAATVVETGPVADKLPLPVLDKLQERCVCFLVFPLSVGLTSA